MRFSICIAAYNEAVSIGTLLAALAGRPDFIDEVVICANGCTDDTVAIAERYAQSDAGCRVVQAPLGKNLAWNTLVREAKNDGLVFMDADVVPQWDDVARLCHALQEGAPAAVGAIAVPCIAGAPLKTALARLVCTPRTHDYLCGRLYVCDRRRVGAAFKERGLGASAGLPQLPLDVLLEDLVLTFVLAPPLLRIDQEATVRYDPGGLDDILRVSARHRAALHQMQHAYSALSQRHVQRQRLPAKLRALMADLAAPVPARDKARFIAGALLRGLLPVVFARPIARHYRTMLAELVRGEGGTILATSGRTRGSHKARR